jgi:hypothetical protein
MKLLLIQIICVLLNLFLTENASSRNIQVTSESKPSWVNEKKAEIQFNNTSGESLGGYYHLLVDIQENIPAESMYCHFVIKLLNSDGVQNMSDISVDFDPEYQTLKFHEINRYREGVKTDELINHNIKTIQREADMERFLYDGSMTAFVNLEDMREGDILEYAYTIQGYNPVYQGNYFRNFYLEYSDPVGEIYRRIIAPGDKKLFFNYLREAAEPVVSKSGGRIEYIWQEKDVKALAYENNVPSWYNASQSVDISSFDNWSDVNRLMISQYRVSGEDLGRLRKEAEVIFDSTNRDSLLFSIIHFVQDNIRYLAFESGMNSIKPESPVKVMASRFGDCKAKSLLLCALLEVYEIEAFPVFVNSIRIPDESRAFPSVNRFNHCVVQINYNGKILNVDPTIPSQGGTIDDFYFPEYGYGLIIKEGTESLTFLKNNYSSQTRISDYLKSDTVGGKASFKVITEYSGSCADDQRYYLQGTSSGVIKQNYLKFYSESFPYIQASAPVKITDDRTRNLITIEENYTIDSIWVRDGETPSKFNLEVGAFVINSIYTVPSSPVRTMPYALSFPKNYTEDIYIDLPEEWTVTPKSFELNDSAFFFSYNSLYKNRQIHLQYKYNTLTSFLQADAFNDFYSNHERIEEWLYYKISYTPEAARSFSFSWLSLVFHIIILVFSTFFAFRIYNRYNPEINTTGDRPIGGWLILIAAGLIISTIVVTSKLFFEPTFFNTSTWQTYLGPENRNILMFLLIVVEFAFNSILLVYLVLLQIMFYKRRNALPRLIIIFYSSFLIFLVLDTFLAFTLLPDSFSESERTKSYYEIGRNLIVSMIWITYFLKSLRVKETFTRVSG